MSHQMTWQGPQLIMAAGTATPRMRCRRASSILLAAKPARPQRGVSNTWQGPQLIMAAGTTTPTTPHMLCRRPSTILLAAKPARPQRGRKKRSKQLQSRHVTAGPSVHHGRRHREVYLLITHGRRHRQTVCTVQANEDLHLLTTHGRLHRHTVHAVQTNDSYLLTTYGRRHRLTFHAAHPDEQRIRAFIQFPLNPRSVTATVPARESLYNNRFRSCMGRPHSEEQGTSVVLF